MINLSLLHPLRNLAVFAALLLALLEAAPVAAEVPRRAILLVEIEDTLTIRMNYYLPVGSMQEATPGVAHYVEHARFKHDGGRAIAAFSAVPGSQYNAVTTHRFTRYELGTQPEGFAAALDFFASLHEPLKLAPADMETERAIIQQELAQRTKSNPDTPFYLDFNRDMLAGSYLARWPGGAADDIAAVTPDEVKAFADAHYPDASSLLIIVGRPLRPEDKESLRAHFPDAAIATIHVPPDRKVVIDDEALQGFGGFLPPEPEASFPQSPVTAHKLSSFAKADAFLHMALFKAPTTLDKVAAAKLLDNAIESRLPEGLHDRLAGEAGLMSDLSVSVSPAQEGWWSLTLNGTLAPGVQPSQVRAVLDPYLAGLARDGLSQKSFDRLKNRFFLRDDWEEPGSKAAALGMDSVLFGYDYAAHWKDRMRKLQRSDVNDFARMLAQPWRTGEAHLEAGK